MTKSEALARVADAIDIETFLMCETEEEAKEASLALLEALGLREGSVIFCEFNGPGARVRLRSYLSRPGKEYPWLRVAVQNPRGGFADVQNQGAARAAGSRSRRGIKDDPARAGGQRS